MWVLLRFDKTATIAAFVTEGLQLVRRRKYRASGVQSERTRYPPKKSAATSLLRQRTEAG